MWKISHTKYVAVDPPSLPMVKGSKYFILGHFLSFSVIFVSFPQKHPVPVPLFSEFMRGTTRVFFVILVVYATMFYGFFLAVSFQC